MVVVVVVAANGRSGCNFCGRRCCCWFRWLSTTEALRHVRGGGTGMACRPKTRGKPLGRWWNDDAEGINMQRQELLVAT